MSDDPGYLRDLFDGITPVDELTPQKPLLNRCPNGCVRKPYTRNERPTECIRCGHKPEV